MNKFLQFSLLTVAGISSINAIELPLKDVTIFSSGVAFYEHELKISGSNAFELTFDEEQIDDFLKSVAISDAGAKKITLEYDSSETLDKTLQSFSVDISQKPTLFELLKNQIGSSLTVVEEKATGSTSITGRILSVERLENPASDISISLVTDSGIKSFLLSNLSQFKFTDAGKNEALLKALSLLDSSSGTQTKKKILLKVEGQGERTVKLSYVLGAPVWKTTYRLLLGNSEAIFQAWAIVDNSTNFDWQDIKLNLVTGKPVSFRQRLYEPYYIDRPEIDLPVEGAAKLEMYESGEQVMAKERALGAVPAMKNMAKASMEYAYADEAIEYETPSEVFSSNASVQADSKFVFTPSSPVSIERQKSMMIPLKVTTLPAKKMTVFSNLSSRFTNPKLCVELTNSSGLNLPAGAITIYDEGYSGDSMVAFLPKDEKRLISYGDDLLLSGRKSTETEDTITKVSAIESMLKVETKRIYSNTYTLKNADSKARIVIIEHPITYDSTLYLTDKPIEQTSSLYRFQVTVPANQTIEYKVNEKRTLFNQYSLLNENTINNILFNYISTGKAPSSVEKLFEKLTSEKGKVDSIQNKLNELHSKLKTLNTEQERTRKNMEALANTSEVGTFTKKLLSLEDEIVATNGEIEKTTKALEEQKKTYNNYIRSLKL